ncbi:hypothetical protein BpHYR1_032952 [Brachionus plicatilis]|uniref:Uncharacterized protein n=1 Tax=Brachionus plicatilis TaxID=10195 RepID=A0A3M7QSI1_BRAPC|nr:hypothetical protein BpHYR1_032952 [Brachionus plicatilis]
MVNSRYFTIFDFDLDIRQPKNYHILRVLGMRKRFRKTIEEMKGLGRNERKGLLLIYNKNVFLFYGICTKGLHSIAKSWISIAILCFLKANILSNIEQKTFFVSNDFVFKDSLNLPIQNDHLMAVAFNNSQDAFVLVDFNGILTWKWKNKINKNRGKNGAINNFHFLIFRKEQYILQDITTSSKIRNLIKELLLYTINERYFMIQKKLDNSIGILNTKFEEVFRKYNASGAILSMVYNSKNDELITSTVEGFRFVINWAGRPVP